MAKYSGGPSEDVLDEFFSLHPSYAECLKFFLGNLLFIVSSYCFHKLSFCRKFDDIEQQASTL